MGGKRQNKRGHGAIDKIIVLGILKLGDKAYTQIVKNCLGGVTTYNKRTCRQG